MLESRLSDLLFVIVASVFIVSPLAAQSDYSVEGFVTRLRVPSGFEVEGRQVQLTTATVYGATGTGSVSQDSPLLRSIRVGAYVQVAGVNSSPFRPLVASEVRIRDEYDRRISGIGVITRVLSPAPEAVFEADGYRIRIIPATKLAFADDLNSLADVKENVWVRFSGKRDRNGVVEAASARFLPPKPTKFKAIRNLEIVPVKVRTAGLQGAAVTVEGKGTIASSEDGADLRENEEVKIGLRRWHTLPADQPLQQRVHRIGMALAPASQQRLAEEDPAKIHFRFYAVDDAKAHTDVCMLDGVVLIPSQLVERFRSDDQVAALLADGIACSLQRQTARMVAENRAWMAVGIAEAFVPGVGLAAAVGQSVRGSPDEEMRDERLRVALALMSDAGFDPWAAPEAWRLAEAKKLPGDLASLPYSSVSAYQLNLLNVQYARAPGGAK